MFAWHCAGDNHPVNISVILAPVNTLEAVGKETVAKLRDLQAGSPRSAAAGEVFQIMLLLHLCLDFLDSRTTASHRKQYD